MAHEDEGRKATANDGAAYPIADVDELVGEIVRYVDSGVTPPVIRPAIVLAVEFVSKLQVDWLKAHPGRTASEYKTAVADIAPAIQPPSDDEKVALCQVVAFGRGSGAWIVDDVTYAEPTKDEPFPAKSFHYRPGSSLRRPKADA